jgi:hydrogenase maturation protease
MSESTTLLLAWGNPGRRDDGLGPALVDALEPATLAAVDYDCDYQLHVEHAEDAARHERVIFIDAARNGSEPFWFRRIGPDPSRVGFSSHSLTPGAVLALSRDLFEGVPEAWVLGIVGHEFDMLREGLSAGASENLAAAVEFLQEILASGKLEERGAPAPRDDEAGE